ncbi:efflux RND transporter permease subunit [Chitinimonas koreensis]|uniref:efflux RND transporter permease subunit n=1 Tax=Chitinimonas koreensis TaxID=356302 RepID=UPI00040443DD|nr:efflux RND transporter permease subunit [Chitinimonas koreensis]QNM97140.1 efflux RND transporter permease subunit [Chitinimonas koreensis]
MRDFNLSDWALKHQQLVLYFIVIFMLAGVFAYTRLGQKEDPEFTFKAMVIQTYWPGASAKDMELQVTDKQEKKLQEMAEIEYVRSYSKAGENQLLINLKEGVPPKQVPELWYQVRKKMSDIRHTLPAGVQGPFFNDEFGDTFGNLYAFTSDGFGYAELKRYVDAVRAELLRVPDVNKVDYVGVQDEKIYVETSNAKLASLGIDPQLVFQTLQATNAVVPAGVVETGSERVALRVTGEFDSVEAIRNIGIRANGRSLRLGDVARVYRGYTDPTAMKLRHNGQEAIGLAVSMRKGGDVIKLGEALDATMRRVKAELPVGIEAHAVSDQPKVVKDSIKEFVKSLAEAVVIVLAVSFLSLGLRTGLVVALSIPLVLAMTFLVMYAFGLDLQRISLGALIIALGLLVDDAIIAVEMMALKLEQGWDRVRAATYAYTSTAFPMLTGTLITAAGFMPVGLAKSNAGEYTVSIFQVVGISLILSWVVAVLFTPYLGYKLLPEMAHHGDEDAVYHKPFYQRFRRLVSWCLEYRKTVILITVVLFVVAAGLFKFVPKQFFPASNRPELMVDVWLPQASTYAQTEQQVKALEARLKREPDVVGVTSYVGNGSPRFYLPLEQQLPNLNFGQLMVMTKNEHVRDTVLVKIQGWFERDFPLVRGRVTRLENGPPVGYPVQFRVSGPDEARLKPVAEQVAAIMRANPHIRHVNTDWSERVKVMRLEVDQDKARALGMTSQQLSVALQNSLSGVTVTQYREHDRTIDVVARLDRPERTDLNNLKDAKVYLPGGRFVPVSQIAHLKLESEESIIWRRNRMPTISVRADVEGAQAPDVTMALWPKIQEVRAKLPIGYEIEIGGSQESSVKGQSSIMAVMPLMLLTVMTLLMFQLQNISKMLLVLLTAPLGMIGVAAILLLFQVPFGFVAQLGVIALAGMIMRNSVILVDQIDQHVKEGEHIWHAIVESAVRRFRPIMLTAAAAILAMIPLTRSTFWGPMAWSIMGGLFVATLLTLLFLPALYAAWYRVRKPLDA